MCRIQVTAWPEGVMITNSSLCLQREQQHCVPDISVDNMQDRGDLVIQAAPVHRCGCPAPGRLTTTTSPNRYGNVGEAAQAYVVQVPRRTSCDAGLACRNLQLLEPRIHACAALPARPATPPPATTFDAIFSKLGIHDVQNTPSEEDDDFSQEVLVEAKEPPARPRKASFLKRAVSYSVGMRRAATQPRDAGSCEKTRLFHRATAISMR